jgi:hypothetical protein
MKKHGGKRNSAGRPEGSTNPDTKKQFSTRLPVEMLTWLATQPNQAQAVENALAEYRRRQE